MDRHETETIIRALQEHGVAADISFTAAAGRDWGHVYGWQLPKGDYALLYGDNGETNYAVAPSEDADDLAAWLLPEGNDLCDGNEDAKMIVANIRGIDAVAAATEGDEGPFRVLRTRYYYGPTQHTDWALDDNGQRPSEWDTLTKAQAWVDERRTESYTTDHNESGRPDYKIVTI